MKCCKFMKPDKPTSKERVEHVLKAIDLIQTYSKGHTIESFVEDNKSIDACLYQYTIIAEATSNIEYKILEKYDYPWFKVKSFRNLILHEYQAVDMRVIWDTTTEILPDLKELMLKILATEF
jgi:uncharacterized protein with HEPN domain